MCCRYLGTFLFLSANFCWLVFFRFVFLYSLFWSSGSKLPNLPNFNLNLWQFFFHLTLLYLAPICSFCIGSGRFSRFWSTFAVMFGELLCGPFSRSGYGVFIPPLYSPFLGCLPILVVVFYTTGWVSGEVIPESGYPLFLLVSCFVIESSELVSDWFNLCVFLLSHFFCFFFAGSLDFILFGTNVL